MRNDHFLRRYEAVLQLQQQMAARGLSSSAAPGNARVIETHQQQFDGLTFRIEPGVFAPHPSSSRVVAEALELTHDMARPVVVDVGTGCGALAIAYALRRPDAEVYAVDYSSAAVACARGNARDLGAHNVHVLEGSLLEPVAALGIKIDLLIANLPWVAPAIVQVLDLESATGWRGPHESVTGLGRDGLGLVRQLFTQAVPLLQPDAVLFVGMDDWQTPIMQQEIAPTFEVRPPTVPYFLTLTPRPAGESKPAP
ncbi:MAG TPA: methyltransferase [Longimicrobiales bacterium]